MSLVFNAVLFFAAFRLLTDGAIATRELRPGIISATILWTLLQAVGGVYITHVVNGAGAAYGTFATVIGLLTWLFLGARVVVYSAELNSVLAGELWPRALVDPPERADRRAAQVRAKIEQRRDDERIEVAVDGPGR